MLTTLALTALVAVGASAAVPTGPAAADTADDLTWSLSPGKGPDPAQVAVGALGADRANYAYTVDPGTEIADRLLVTNLSATSLDLSVYATDASTTREGHLDLLPADAEPTGLGTWLELDVPAGEISLDPGETVRVPFRLVVPEGATPGDHAGGLVTSLRQATGDGALTVDRRLALRVHARVSGELSPGLVVQDVTVSTPTGLHPLATATSTVTYTLENTGDTRIVPTEAVTVTGPGSSAPRSTTAELEEVLPGAVVERTVEVPGVRPLFRAGADVRVDGVVVGIGGGGTALATGAAGGWAVPWSLLAVALLVAGAAVGLSWWRARRSVG
nr:DUF916 domain-containing protein [Isoptericola halotolerans]